jgi:hypothetical protein
VLEDAMSPATTEPTSALHLRAHFRERSGLTAPAGIVASGTECAAFRLWIDDLPEEGSGALLQLRQYGFVYDLSELEAQLFCALRDGPAGPLARIVGQRVLDLLAAHPSAVCFFLEEGD